MYSIAAVCFYFDPRQQLQLSLRPWPDILAVGQQHALDPVPPYILYGMGDVIFYYLVQLQTIAFLKFEIQIYLLFSLFATADHLVDLS